MAQFQLTSPPLGRSDSELTKKMADKIIDILSVKSPIDFRDLCKKIWESDGADLDKWETTKIEVRRVMHLLAEHGKLDFAPNLGVWLLKE